MPYSLLRKHRPKGQAELFKPKAVGEEKNNKKKTKKQSHHKPCQVSLQRGGHPLLQKLAWLLSASIMEQRVALFSRAMLVEPLRVLGRAALVAPLACFGKARQVPKT